MKTAALLSLVILSGCAVPKWILTVYEPAEHAGFARPYHDEASCLAAARSYQQEEAAMKSAGKEALAPVARCVRH